MFDTSADDYTALSLPGSKDPAFHPTRSRLPLLDVGVVFVLVLFSFFFLVLVKVLLVLVLLPVLLAPPRWPSG